jgi:site-specific recombinase XerD
VEKVLVSPAQIPLKYHARQAFLERIAPRYQTASLAQKSLLLDRFVEMTGYARKSAIRLLNHPSPSSGLIQRSRLPLHGPEVQQALFLAWKAANYICAKRLVPFLPTLVPSLERHGHLQISEKHRGELLTMSSSTAERFLRNQRKPRPHGISTTKAGTMLKHHIPIRTFAGWENTRPGFLEVDLVAHCGGHTQGSYLYTLTLTDVATGWTECLPLLARTADLVVKALERARTLFPFPILGIDTDNGAEFINEDLVAYCEREHLTFTRGRPEQKNDQCFVEERNREVVRRVVGYDRLVGEHACRQLAELYRALHLYVNCFQPSMKLVSKQQEGNRVRCVYDPAKTPLQRLLLSEILPASKQQELSEIVQRLDPLGLAEQVEQLQHAVFRCAVSSPSFGASSHAASLLRFSSEPSLSEPGPARSTEPDPAATLSSTLPQQQERTPFLNWRRSSTNPFASEGERLLAWVQAHPEWSVRTLFEELERLFPGRYPLAQYPALQRAVRKIRAHLHKQAEDPWPLEIIHGPLPDVSASESGEHQGLQSTNEHAATSAGELPSRPPAFEPPQATHEANEPEVGILFSIDQAIQSFLQERRTAGREGKTLAWHQVALCSLRAYLARHDLGFLEAITTAVVRNWLAGLRSEPLETGTVRTASTINAYARSARAFCHWLVRKGVLARTPFVKGTVPKATSQLTRLITSEEFEQLLGACGQTFALMDHATARNRALLWLFWETGLLVTEVCGLRLWDVDREQGQVRIQRPDESERSVPLGANALQHLLWYLDQFRLSEAKAETGEGAIFLSEKRRPLTPNAITLFFLRLSSRAGMSGKGVNPSVLRDTFAVRYLRQGGHAKTLQKLLGLASRAALKRYQEAARSFPHQTPEPRISE